MKVQVKKSRLPQWRRSKRNLLMNKAERRASESTMKVSYCEVSKEDFSFFVTSSALRHTGVVLFPPLFLQIEEFNLFCVYSGEDAPARVLPTQRDVQSLAKGKRCPAVRYKNISIYFYYY